MSYQFAGIDLHKRYSYITVVNQNGKKISQQKVQNDPFAIQKALSQLNKPITRAAVEATFNSYWLVDILRDINIDTVITHPTKLKAITSSKIKTDKIDSETIAKLNCYQLLPLSYIPTQEERTLKDIIRFRFSLVRQRATLKNKVQNKLLRNCIFDHPFKDIFGKSGQKWLKQLTNLPDLDKQQLLDYLDLINSFTKKIKNHDKVISELSTTNRQAKLLQTIPGVGPIVAMTLISEIGNVSRFPNSRFLSGYAGLVPSTYSSGGKTTHGQVTKTGSKFIRYALGEAVIHTIKKNDNLKQFYDKLLEKKGKSKAKVACMRKLLSYIYIMLKDNLRFDQLNVNQTG
jgi:transposase